MEKIDWNAFWINYRNIESDKEEDLFFQVGKTVNKMPISEESFNAAFEDIANSLKLHDNDIVLEMCCGNGLISKPLSKLVHKIYAFDFTPHLIEGAKKFKQTDNVNYVVGDAKSNYLDLFVMDELPGKFLMVDALAYFSPDDLDKMLDYISRSVGKFSFYLTGAPNDAIKWNFYNTEERKQYYLDGVNKGDESNNGMGRWWKKSELLELAEKHNLKVTLKNQKDVVSNYRMDVLFEKE